MTTTMLVIMQQSIANMEKKMRLMEKKMMKMDDVVNQEQDAVMHLQLHQVEQGRQLLLQEQQLQQQQQQKERLQFSTAWLDSQVKQQQNQLQQMSSSNRARAGQGLSDGRGTFKRMLAKTHTEVVPATNSEATASSADTRGDGADWRGWQDWRGAWSSIFRKTATASKQNHHP